MLFLATAVFAVASAAVADPSDLRTTTLLLRIVGQQLLVVLGTAWLIARLGQLTRREVIGPWLPGRRWLTASALLALGWALAQTPLLHLWSALTGAEAPTWWDRASAGSSAGAMVAAVLALAVVPPICEEVFFRGVFLHRLRALGTPAAIVIQGAMFAAYHVDAYGAPVQLAAGLCLGLLRVSSGSLVVGVLAHGLNNLVALWELNRGATLYDSFGPVAAVAGVGLFVMGLWLARGARRASHVEVSSDC